MDTSVPGNRTEEGSNIFNPESKIPVATMLVLLFAASLIGNCLVIAVVYNNVNKKMRTTMNLFVVNMAVSDQLTTVFSIPISVYSVLLTRKKIPNPNESTADLVLCKVNTAVWLVSSGVSLLSHVTICLDRFWAVFFPTKRPLTSSKPNIIVSAIWLFSICFAIFPILVRPVECGAQLNSLHINFIYLYFVLYLGMPTVTILVLYPAILIKLWSRKIPGNTSTANQELRNRTNRKVTILAAALIISFAVSWFPNVGQIVKYLVEKPSSDRAYQKEEGIFKTIALVLTYSSCLWNPLICIVLNSNFRAGFKTILRTFCSYFSVTISNCCKKNEIANVSSRAMDFGQDHSDIQLTGMNNLQEN